MNSEQNKLILKVAGLGAVAGMRASMAPAVMSHFLSKQPAEGLAQSKLAFIQSPVAAVITKALSAIEVAGDKLPYAGDRIDMPQVLARVGSGAFVGAALFQAGKQSIVKGLLIGGVAALAATFATFYLRKYADKLPHVNEPYTGAAEDLIAIGSSVALLK